ncbi:tyrosine-protein phosphatase [Microbacterium thalassium]|uniref:Tyrosine-protein phosphatase n=1 Tax=Microbacterium thalassium TaxID=362649 RepID=A0A7X0KU18_9MICO|nr:tyrosine-protein phosphatase [Microbacterium thalassium]MBB6390633.1 hypothetical protein [Microbacterium thalassium]GLK25742.1 putative phosphotyrosine protein phosphatase [Microbacterium thalassium]
MSEWAEASRPPEPLQETPLNNLRDLAGIRVEGGVLAPHRVFRSDDVSTVPADQASRLFDLGIRTVIDLRSRAESDHTGRGALGRHEVRYVSLPLVGGAADPEEFLRHLREGTATPTTVGEYYAATAAAEAETIARGLRVITASDGATLFHCQAGKDRTGIFAGVLLGVLGADPDDIAADYAASAEAVPRIMARVSASIGHLMGESDEYFRAAAAGLGPVSPLLGAEADAMHAMLDILDARHGGARALLRSAGFDDAEREALRVRVVAGPLL